ncbi:MAG: hypothetical protein AYK19_22570 [Theionarchaea archaeon DG-70-1]|nr:MAG: hypothetical protein AYK19_22570 [Theionarchaea archaeon DG-70-1]
MKEKKSGKGYRFDENGWIYLHIEGDAFERGFQHGFLVAPELDQILKSVKYLTYFNTGKMWEFFVDAAVSLFLKFLEGDDDYQEFLNEMQGIASGAREGGTNVTWQEILAWNGYEELTDYWWPNAIDKYRYAPSGCCKDHCSAFMAHGEATADGKIVMAHNTWNNFEMGQFCNVILDINPSSGHEIFMQSSPGFIESQTDFFLTGAGIMGTETTIGGFSLYDENEVPEFVRIRKAMQYADNLDEFVNLMKKKNNGGYANSWLLGNSKTNDIMRFELGLKFYNVELNPTEHYFVGFNAPLDPRIRNLECSNTGFADIRRHQGARQVRLPQLIKKYYKSITCEIAQTIIADHGDVYPVETEADTSINPCSRTVCGHYELDDRAYMSDPSRPKPYQPRGAVDGKVCDSGMAENLSFWARWGNSCGMEFDADTFLDNHPQWDYLRGYLFSRSSQDWTQFSAGQNQ